MAGKPARKIIIMSQAFQPNTKNYPLDRTGKLLHECKQVSCFEHEGRMYLGYYVDAVKQFIAENPKPADFSVWLQDTHKQLTILK